MSNFLDSPIHQQFFEADTRAAVREHLSARGFKWFTHTTPVKHRECILKHDLQPRDPEVITFPEAVARNGHAYQMVCLAPHPSRHDWRNLRLPPPYMRLSVSLDDLADDLGLDWSFDANWNLADILRTDHPTWAPQEIFVEVMKRRSVLITYTAIPSKVLRVHTKQTNLLEPSRWPLLSETNPDYIVLLE